MVLVLSKWPSIRVGFGLVEKQTPRLVTSKPSVDSISPSMVGLNPVAVAGKVVFTETSGILSCLQLFRKRRAKIANGITIHFEIIFELYMP